VSRKELIAMHREVMQYAKEICVRDQAMRVLQVEPCKELHQLRLKYNQSLELLKEQGLSRKVVLLLDNGPSHPIERKLT
jgi:hypothetical protein